MAAGISRHSGRVIMKLVLVRIAPATKLLWAERALIGFGVLMLAYCGLVRADLWIFQHAAIEHLPTGTSRGVGPPAFAGGVIGRLEISRVGISVIVVEGTSDSTLRRAAGHISGTALPGEPGNVGIAAHRDTLFRPLQGIGIDDVITLSALGGEFRYRVVSTNVVSPSDVAVLNPADREMLTLVTCFPFYFIGPAPNRFVVRAQRM